MTHTLTGTRPNPSRTARTEQQSSQTQTDTATDPNKPRPEQPLTNPIPHTPRGNGGNEGNDVLNDVLKDSCTVS